MGVEYRETLELLLGLCKGRVVDKSTKWFYYLFLDRPRSVYGEPNSVQEVISKLRSAWWVEEDDLEQEIHTYIHKIRPGAKPNILSTIARALRDYLICNQKIFSRQTNWMDSYRHSEIEEPSIQKSLDLGFLFNNQIPLSLYSKYLVYLSGVLGLPQQQMSVILLQSKRQVKRYVAKLRKEMEKNNACTTITE